VAGLKPSSKLSFGVVLSEKPLCRPPKRRTTNIGSLAHSDFEVAGGRRFVLLAQEYYVMTVIIILFYASRVVLTSSAGSILQLPGVTSLRFINGLVLFLYSSAW